MNFLTHIFKNLATLHMDFFWVGNPTYFCFLKIGRNYGWIIITIISNITVLVSHNVICFGHFMSMSHGANKKAPTIIPPPQPPDPHTTTPLYQACYFTRNILSIFFCSDQIIEENNAFLK